jgi:hypothetical protein
MDLMEARESNQVINQLYLLLQYQSFPNTFIVLEKIMHGQPHV